MTEISSPKDFSPHDDRWQFWIDRGGTFTDVIALSPNGQIHTKKLLSENTAHYPDSAIEGIRQILQLEPGVAIPIAEIGVIKMGTTVATNALLERKGAQTALITTKGFGDAIRIGYQNRPNLFALHIEPPEMLYSQVVEIEERIGADGSVIKSLNLEQAALGLKNLRNLGIESLAICFMHGYRYPAHEQRVGALAKSLGFRQVSLSHEVSPLIKFVSRGDTTLVDAYLSPTLHHYIDRFTSLLNDRETFSHLYFMQSNGGLVRADKFEGKDAVLSGPAGGVVGMVETAKDLGFEKVIGFDMGGTSTDVSHYNGVYERSFETNVSGVRLRSPMMNIHTVAAGGGSIIHYDGNRLRVGPHSAGAEPGPACYRKGGPLTVTDANVMVGKLNPAHFPCVFGPSANEPLDAEIVSRQFTNLAEDIGGNRSVEDIADGCLQIAVQNMANAIKNISVSRGYDVSNYILNCFGGAGAQHACMVANALGMRSILIHPHASLLSALGIGLADIRAHKEQSTDLPLNGDRKDLLDKTVDQLTKEATGEVKAQQVDAENIQIEVQCYIKYQGSDTSLPVPYGTSADMGTTFTQVHRKRFGFIHESTPLVLEAVAVEAIGKTASIPPAPVLNEPRTTRSEFRQTQFYSCGSWHTADIIQIGDLDVEQCVIGPALIVEPHSTIVVEPSWRAKLTRQGGLLLERDQEPDLEKSQITVDEVDPIRLEIFNNLFMNIAEQMGFTLQNTATSVNIKERLDFSCALFDGSGGLVANAPHVPVHLGSMSVSVRTVMNRFKKDMQVGDFFVLNDPFDGGTHLPDVTVVAPVFDTTRRKILFYVAARGHHADIGGLSPGSMPAMSHKLEDEGVVIPPTRIVRDGDFDEGKIRHMLDNAPYPARNIAQNISDLKAQVASCEMGAQQLVKLVDQYGLNTVQAYMRFVQDNAEECVRRAIDRIKPGACQMQMDDGSVIAVNTTIDSNSRSATIDFTGTSRQVTSNFNAPVAVTRAAVLYAFRCLVADDIPLNEGCLKPIDIILPEECLLNPVYPAAVVAGNVETSQHITDAIFGALGVLAASQGTMNNFTFGNQYHQYYETICGGSGAGNGFDGADGVQTHMTNSRLTDPEVFEHRFPVRVRSFSLRPTSGGSGRFHGGNGVVREMTFLEPMEVSLLTSRRVIAPPGLMGGGAGLKGENSIERADGTLEQLRGRQSLSVNSGDSIIIRTPGGGGFGRV